jgi:hypothetical protein
MRRFTPPAASPAIDNYRIEIGSEKRQFPAKLTGPPGAFSVPIGSERDSIFLF